MSRYSRFTLVLVQLATATACAPVQPEEPAGDAVDAELGASPPRRPDPADSAQPGEPEDSSEPEDSNSPKDSDSE